MRLYVTGAPGGFAFSTYWAPLNSHYVASWRPNSLLAVVNLELTHVASAVHFQFWGSGRIIAKNRSEKVIYSMHHSHTHEWSFLPISIANLGEKIKTIVVEFTSDPVYKEALCAQFRVTY
ncbi:hypothetical protein D3C77_510330 [compost metagenome]